VDGGTATADADDDADTAFDYPAHVLVSARDAPALVSNAPRSVFDLPTRELPASRLWPWWPAKQRSLAVGADGTGAIEAKRKVVATVDVGPGITRTIGAVYPERWTEEDHERERMRRAKQRPPKPPKRAKTRGRKLRDLIGDDNWD